MREGSNPGWIGRLGLAAGRLLIGRRFTGVIEEMKRAQWLSPEELKSRSEAHLARLLSHAARHVPFYREAYRERGIDPDALTRVEDLTRLPIADKALYRSREPEAFLADDIGPHRRQKYTTSGSTGEPFPFYLDRASMPLVFSSHLFYDSWFDLKPFDRYVRIAAPPAPDPPIPEGTPLSFRVKQRLRTRLQTTYERLTQRKFTTFDIDPARIDEIHALLVSFKPAYMMGYTSSLAMLGDELARRGLPLARPLKGVITIAETVSPTREKQISEYFRAPIINRYGMREFKYWCAQSCHVSPHRFHINTELVVWEVVRADGTTAGPGEVGRVVLTNLHNHVMPFIRYDTKDLAALSSERCECGRGFPLAVKLEGRSQEVLQTPSGRMINPVSLGHYLFVTHDYVDRVRHYQLVQSEPTRVTLKVVPTNGIDDDTRGRLRADIESLVGEGVRVEVEVVDDIPLESSGKRPIIKILRNGHGR